MATPASQQPNQQNASDAILNSIITTGDLSRLSPDQKTDYYRTFCERLGLDPISQPFKLLRLNGKEIMYCDRSGSQQLCKLHSVSHEIKAREIINGCYVVTTQALTPDGRRTESIGAVPIENLKGDNLCNAMMKAETKSKRRATLDLLGLGILDETEADALIPEDAKAPVPVTSPKPVPPDQAKSVPATPATPPVLPPNTKQPNGPQPVFQKKYATMGELEETLSKATSINHLSELYYNNIEAIEKNAAMKALFTARKLQITNGTPVPEVSHTTASAVEALKECKSVDDLADLKNLLPAEVLSDPEFETAAEDRYHELEGVPY